jgi:predicted metal-dependent hydrolase
MDIQYQVKFSERKTISIIIERDRSVIVRAPFNTAPESINSLIQKKKFLLFKKINQPNKYPSPKPFKEFVSGESILFLGDLYKLRIENEIFEGIRFEKEFYISNSNKAKANALLKKFYVEQANEKLIPRIKRFAERLGVNYKLISIREMKYRWGSCTPKDNLNFNWRIIKAPINVIDYIIVHELAHLLEPNHTPEFWNIISVQLPNYKKAKEWLKNNGHLLEVDFS